MIQPKVFRTTIDLALKLALFGLALGFTASAKADLNYALPLEIASGNSSDRVAYVDSGSIVNWMWWTCKASLTRDLHLNSPEKYDLTVPAGALIYFNCSGTRYTPNTYVVELKFDSLKGSTVFIGGVPHSVLTLNSGVEMTPAYMTISGTDSFSTPYGPILCSKKIGDWNFNQVSGCDIQPQDITLKTGQPVSIDRFNGAIHVVRGVIQTKDQSPKCRTYALKDLSGNYNLNAIDHTLVDVTFDQPQFGKFMDLNGKEHIESNSFYEGNSTVTDGTFCKPRTVYAKKISNLSATSQSIVYNTGHGAGHCHFPNGEDGNTQVCKALGFSHTQRPWSNDSPSFKDLTLTKETEVLDLSTTKQFCGRDQDLGTLPRIGLHRITANTVIRVVDEVTCRMEMNFQ